MTQHGKDTGFPKWCGCYGRCLGLSHFLVTLKMTLTQALWDGPCGTECPTLPSKGIPVSVSTSRLEVESLSFSLESELDYDLL